MAASSSSRIVLHEAKTTFLLWVIPVFVVVGCLLVAMNIWLPLLSRPPADAGPRPWLSIGIAILAGLAVPAGAGLMFFLIPQITTTLDPQRREVSMEFRRPAGRSVKAYPLDDIAGIKPVHVRRRLYTLALILKSGESVRLDYTLLPEATRLQQEEKIKAQLAPYSPRNAIA